MSVVIVIILKGMNLLYEFGSILPLACSYYFSIVWNCSDNVGLIYYVNYMNFQHFIPYKI